MNSSLKTGYIMAVIAFILWGVAPIYFKAIHEVSPFEIVAHRVLWSVFTLSIILFFIDRKFIDKVWTGFKSHFWTLTLAAILLTTNWLVFIYAISIGQILEASLGYYINPLLNVAMGAIFLGERFSRLQKIAVILALIGVAQEIFRFGQIPMISLILAGTFGTYGLIRKKAEIGGTEGLLIETLIMMPFAISYLVYLEMNGNLSFMHTTVSTTVLLLAAGLVTTLPLIFFIGASKRIKYSTLGMYQYIGPTLMGLLGYYFYQETFPEGRLVTFALVWTGLALTVFESLRKRKK